MYTTINTETSQYIYQKNVKEYPGKVAVMAQFMPSFDEVTKTGDKIEYTDDPFELTDTETTTGSSQKYSFVFIVDRSGSMWGIRIELVIEALQMFMKSLPEGCTFKIISFGSNFDSLYGQNVVAYNEEKSKDAIDKIGDFDANFGGT
jgi:uncharacterized protein with von Willebrand factor type A (vWA) domain